MAQAALALAAAALAALAAAPALGHPGHGPGTVTIGSGRFSPAELTVAKGDTVIWFWSGDDRNHSVTADDGQDESFDSDSGTAPPLVMHERNDAFSHRFDRLGTFSYHCKVHPATMHGKIVVQKPPPRDVFPPRITRLRLRRDGHRLRVRFRISEQAFAVASVRRRGKQKMLRYSSGFFRRGRHRLTVSIRGLRRGDYRVVLAAEDNAGNSARRSKRFAIG